MNTVAITSHFAIIEPTPKICDYLRMQPLNFLPVGAAEFSAKSQIQFDQTPEDDESGLTWRQELSLVTDDRELLKYNGCRMLVAFWMSDGSLRVVGNASAAPRLKITPYAGVMRLDVSFDSPEPMIL